MIQHKPSSTLFPYPILFCFFFNDTATTEIYTLSLHDALPISDTITQDTFIQAYTHLARFQGRSELETWLTRIAINRSRDWLRPRSQSLERLMADRKSTRLNSSHT